MGKPCSLDLRERVVAAVELEGMSRNRAAARFGVAASSAIKWVARFRATGSAAPAKMGGYKKKTLSGEHASWLIARCRQRDFTISQLVDELIQERGLKVDRHSVWEFLHAEGLSFKKTLFAKEQDRPDIARRREQWRKYQGRIDPGRLVFIDETWAKTNMAPLRGWGTLRRSGQGQGPLRSLEDHDLHRRPQVRPHRGALSARWPDQWRGLPGLGPNLPGPDAPPGRRGRHG